MRAVRLHTTIPGSTRRRLKAKQRDVPAPRRKPPVMSNTAPSHRAVEVRKVQLDGVGWRVAVVTVHAQRHINHVGARDRQILAYQKASADHASF